MADRHEIKCVTKRDRYDSHERITHVGGINRDGSSWKITQEEAVAGIKNGKWAFFVDRGGRSAEVEVATSRFGNEYLKTVADGEQPDNLLSLMECRA